MTRRDEGWLTRRGQGCCLAQYSRRNSRLASAIDDRRLSGPQSSRSPARRGSLIVHEVVQVGLINRWNRDSQHDLIAFPQACHGEVLRGGVDDLLTWDALIRAVDQYHLVVYVETEVVVRTGVLRGDAAVEELSSHLAASTVS